MSHILAEASWRYLTLMYVSGNQVIAQIVIPLVQRYSVFLASGRYELLTQVSEVNLFYNYKHKKWSEVSVFTEIFCIFVVSKIGTK